MKHHPLQWLLIPFTALSYVASLVQVIFYRPKAWHWTDGCLELVAGTRPDGSTRIWGQPQGQCLGNRIVWVSEEAIREHRVIPVHERVHCLHGEWVCALTHVLLAPVGLFLLPPSWTAPLFIVAQAAFGLAYGGHFLWLWARSGFGPWRAAYYDIWSERIAYRADDAYEHGKNPGAWGG